MTTEREKVKALYFNEVLGLNRTEEKKEDVKKVNVRSTDAKVTDLFNDIVKNDKKEEK